MIDQVGTPQDIYRKAGAPFVADFVGSHEFPRRRGRWPAALRVGSLELGRARR